MDESDEQDYSPVIEMVIAWVKEFGKSWECEGDSSSRIKFAFERGGLMYTATAIEEYEANLTLRVKLPLIGDTDALRIHDTLADINEARFVGSVTYHRTRSELVWRDTLFLQDDAPEEDTEAEVATVEELIVEAVATFDAVRKRLAAFLCDTPTKADLSVMPAQGGRC